MEGKAMSDDTITTSSDQVAHQPSEAAYRTHRRRGETACADCRRAHADYVRARRLARGDQHTGDSQ
jgi:hypothetical protein